VYLSFVRPYGLPSKEYLEALGLSFVGDGEYGFY
jgi:hypothetical protein